MARGMFSVRQLMKEQEASTDIASLFINQLEQAIVKLDPPYKGSNYYKPSSLVCKRQMYFVRQGLEQEEEKKSASSIGILESGSDRHNRVQHAINGMKDLGLDFEYYDVETYVKEHNLPDIEIIGKNDNNLETKCFNKKYKLSFLTDGIVKHITTGEFYIFEYKTETSRKFVNRQHEEFTHRTQAACYALSFNIRKTLFVYENRDICTKKCFLYEATDEEKQWRVVDKINEVEKCLETKTVPPKVVETDIDPNATGGRDRVDGASAKVCMYCGYKKECNKYL